MYNDNMKSDEDFLRDFSESHKWVALAYRWLLKLGYEVEIPPHSLRPSSDQRREYMDDGDLAVLKKDVKSRVEVKQRPDIPFHDVDSFPFDTIIVDEAYKIDRTGVLDRLGYLIFNSTGSHVCAVPETTKPYWSLVKKWDHKQKRHCEYYECPLSQCTIHKVNV